MIHFLMLWMMCKMEKALRKDVSCCDICPLCLLKDVKGCFDSLSLVMERCVKG